MKIIKYIALFVFIAHSTNSFAQDANQIVDQYLEKSGGESNWNNLKATKMDAVVNYEGMEIPLAIYSTKQGKQAIVINFQGQEFTQFAFDGETMWTTNMMTMQPEKSNKEISDNMKLSINDFPNPFLNYKEKGYILSYEGEEKIDNQVTYKVKLQQEPIMIDGEEQESVSYYYFDTTTYLPVKMQTEIVNNGNATQINQSIMKDYKEVKGLYFPFTFKEGGQDITIKSIEINPKIDDALFEFPSE